MVVMELVVAVVKTVQVVAVVARLELAAMVLQGKVARVD
jgi:hypothetical protein